MAVSDIFSTSFLFSVSIIIILIGGIFAYVSYRMGEQDHKLNSMIALISTMAEESRFFRSKISMLQQKLNGSADLPDVDKIQYASQMMGGEPELINVSDGESEDDADSNADSDADSDADSNADSNADADADSDADAEESDNEENKILNLSLADDEENEITDIIDVEQLSEIKEEIKTVHLENPIDLENNEIEEHKIIDEIEICQDDMNFLKNVSITDLEEVKPDYKKMAINKLREIVVSKGIVVDASKLKKNDILKLLSDA